jgi:hypothetical protein
MNGVPLPLSYDPDSGNFTVTFPLLWIFPHDWPNSRRNDYIADFVFAVGEAWDDRFELQETGSRPRTARVHNQFDNRAVWQRDSAEDEALELMLLHNAEKRWLVDVRNLSVRENVKPEVSVVELGQTSNKPHKTTVADAMAGKPFTYSQSGGNQTLTQTASAHEFGHMIGLADEYATDLDDLPVPTAERGFINDRIMNAGNQVTADAYAPYADWLSGLTSTTWRVGRKIGK